MSDVSAESAHQDTPLPHAPPPGSQARPEDPDERYRPLPTGTHGLDPEAVKRDQRERLQHAMIELIAEKGYPAVRIVDLARLAHVSQPTFYRLYADKEALFMCAYEEIAQRTAQTVMQAYSVEGPDGQRLRAGMRAFAQLAVADPEAMSLLVLGAFGAGSKPLEGRRHALEALEAGIRMSRDRASAQDHSDLTVRMILGGIREVTAARLRHGRAVELAPLADELAAWAGSYPRQLPAGLSAPAATPPGAGDAAAAEPSERARRAEGRLPSGRSELPRQFIVKSQRERIVDATAAIVAEKGLAALTIPEIARRANISHQTFYEIYDSKRDAFLGAQKIGLHQALQVAIKAYEGKQEDWPSAVAAGLRALIAFLASEPAHAHLSVVDTFAASPEAIEIRDTALHAFAAYLGPGYELAGGDDHVPAIAAEAIAGGIWQILHNYVANDCLAGLPGAAAQITYMALTPFIGPERAAAAATA
ncbi:MAG TPA: TetR/AcrR family transcriptional regulator [Solirubrobacteraceae bacterium]|nr:TetR/AcrR family transcriptional regulator [Solirubrobacteraceae bacterium]